MNLRPVGLALVALGLITTVTAATGMTPPDGAPSVTNVTWIEQPDTRVPIESIPWCDDEYGHSSVLPCKWDSRERPAPTWDPQAAPVAVWVSRAVGCQPLIRHIKIADDNSVAWACYFAPGT